MRTEHRCVLNAGVDPWGYLALQTSALLLEQLGAGELVHCRYLSTIGNT